METDCGVHERQAAAGGDFLRADAEEHFRAEYSTYDWIVDGLLARAGFDIREKSIRHGVIGTYYCSIKSTTAQT
ncbi:MAG: putative AdoMet-dependent methyltransferase [Yoonia sp.]|jgi:putative AdoMet-dependent methyltransferase